MLAKTVALELMQARAIVQGILIPTGLVVLDITPATPLALIRHLRRALNKELPLPLALRRHPRIHTPMDLELLAPPPTLLLQARRKVNGRMKMRIVVWGLTISAAQTSVWRKSTVRDGRRRLEAGTSTEALLLLGRTMFLHRPSRALRRRERVAHRVRV